MEGEGKAEIASGDQTGSPGEAGAILPQIAADAPSPDESSVSISYWGVFIICVAVSALTLFAYDRFYATKVAVFDFAGYIEKTRNDVATGKIDNNQMLARLDEVKKMLDSMPSNVIVLAGDTILGNPKKVQKLVLP